VLSLLPGELHVSVSTHEILPDENTSHTIDEQHSPILLHTFESSGLPPHELKLKVGCQVILLRNIRRGLSNGTRMVVLDCQQRFLTVQPISGQLAGSKILLPRIELTPAGETGLPYKFKRIQFPVQLCYALSINKSQGQTFRKVGILLKKPVFAHGQLYVALSRARNRSSIKIQIAENEEQGKLTNSGRIYIKN
jgi:ATP-dependent DNA helicase PIF1